MNGLSLDTVLLRILNKLNDNISPIDSPNFIGTPRVPFPNGENKLQIVNTEYVTYQLEKFYNVLLDMVNNLEKSTDKYNDIDKTKLVNDIIKNIIGKISSEDIGTLLKHTVTVNACNIEQSKNHIKELINNTLSFLAFLNDGRISNVYNYKVRLQEYLKTVDSKCNDLITAHDDYLKGTDTKVNFINKYTEWYSLIEEIVDFSDRTLRVLNDYLKDEKLDVNQMKLFNLIVNNNYHDGLYFEKEDGINVLYVDGAYCDLSNCKIDNDQMDTLVIENGKIIKLDVSVFTYNKKTIEDLVLESLNSNDIMKNSVNMAIQYIDDNIETLNVSVVRLQNRLSGLRSEVNDDISTDIVNIAYCKNLDIIFNDLQSRYNAVVEEIDCVYLFKEISEEDKLTLKTYKDSLIVSYNSFVNQYNKCIYVQSIDNFNDFDSAVEIMNTNIGNTRALCFKIINNINVSLEDVKMLSDKQSILSYLDDSEDTFKLHDNFIEVIGENIKCTDFNITNGTTTKYCNVMEYNNSPYFTTKNDQSIKLYVNGSVRQTDSIFKNEGTYKTIQDAIDVIPNVLSKPVTISLLTDNDGNTTIQSKYGSSLTLLTNGKTIYGNILMKNCNSRIYITSTEGINIGKTRLSLDTGFITPYSLLHYENYYCTILAINCSYVQIHKSIVIGKLYYPESIGFDSGYKVQNRNYAIGCVGSNMLIGCSGITHSDNGIFSTENGKTTVTMSYSNCTYDMNTDNGGTIYYYNTFDKFGRLNDTGFNSTAYNVSNYHNIMNIKYGHNVTTSEFGTTLGVDALQIPYKQSKSNLNVEKIVASECLSYGINIDSTLPTVESCVGVGTPYIGETRDGYWFFNDDIINNYELYGKDNIDKIVLCFNRIDCGNENERNHSGKARIHFHDYSNKEEMFTTNGNSYNEPRISSWYYVVDIDTYDETDDGLIRIELSENDISNIFKNDTPLKGFCILDEYSGNNGAVCKLRSDMRVYIYYK